MSADKPYEDFTFFVSIKPEAEAEIKEAYQWYESRAQGLGAEFVRAVDACLSSIERNPRSYAVIHDAIRRALLRRFPYGIFYFLDGQRIVVIACFHASRDPQHWQRRA